MARAALAERARCSIGLSGGSTPQALFHQFATEFRASVPWERVDYFWVDERAVPPDDPRSNFALADRSWLGTLPIPRSRIHRIRGEADTPEAAAREYDGELGAYLGRGSAPGVEILDVALLGMGKDGHTASLFPGSGFLTDSGPRVAVEMHPALEPLVPRITLTLSALNRSRFVGFLVAGEEKHAPFVRALRGSGGKDVPPAGLVRGLESTEWFVDRAAAGPDESASTSWSDPTIR